MSTTAERLAAAHPQRIVRYVEICDRCKAHNSFRLYRCFNGVNYAKCNKCGRQSVITLIIRAQK